LLCHGNAGNIGDRLEMAKALLQTGVNVFLFDYRGYGRSQGRPSEEGTYRDAQAAHQWLQQQGFEGANIIAFGESLGGGIASELALRAPLGGLVLQSTFSCMTDIGSRFSPGSPCVGCARSSMKLVPSCRGSKSQCWSCTATPT